MLAPALTKKARDAATSHVRVQVVAVRAPEGFDGGPCEIDARVDRVFRTKVPVSVDDRLILRVHCYVPPDGSPTGPAWLDYSRLQPDALLEAFLNKTAAEPFEVALFQIAFTAEAGQSPDQSLWPNASPTASVGWLGRVAGRFKGLLGA